MGFEIGPIRPPSEVYSLLLRVTRNCPWNKCKFCRLYKKHSFSTRSIEEIRADIDQIAQSRRDILNWTSGDISNYDLIRVKLDDMPEEIAQTYRFILQWMLAGEESVFLQDANTMVLSYNKLREILLYLREQLPQAKRVTSYGRVDSLVKFSDEQFAALKKAGLDRIHSGFESGSDKVLELINKGYTRTQEIEAGQKIKAAGLDWLAGNGGAL